VVAAAAVVVAEGTAVAGKPAELLDSLSLDSLSHPMMTKVGTFLLVGLPFAGTLAAGWLAWEHIFAWRDLLLLVAFYVPTSLGITVGFHRYLCHYGFRPHPAVKVVLLILGSMALLGAPIDFAGTHRRHHMLGDRAGDPHSPLDGFFHAHMGWLFSARVIDYRIYARDLYRDPTIVWVNRLFPVWAVLGLVLPLALGGWQGLVWGGLVRLFLTHHVTWSVNSVCHTFGRREFATRDRSRNEWIVGLLAFGEGWHNNHHAFPRSALHGLHWWQFDGSGLLIRLLGRLRLVSDIQRVDVAEMVSRRQRPAAAGLA
jgi:stearoyl-CoA desaturase (Delta-9 desaturase)